MKRLVLTICWIGSFFLLLEGGLRCLVPVPTAPALRNAYFRRFWPEYTTLTKEKTSGQRRVVFIANSQAYGRELAPEKIYTAQLQQILNRSGKTSVEIYNWAVPGAIAHDLYLLTAKAVAEQFDEIYVVIYPENFSAQVTGEPLSFSIADTPLLVGEKAVRSIVGEDFLASYGAGDYWPTVLQRYSYVCRSNGYVGDLLHQVTQEKETFSFGNAKVKTTLLANGRPAQSSVLTSPDLSYLTWFDKLLSHGGPSRFGFVLMPLATGELTSDSVTLLREFNRALVTRYRNTSVRVFDLTDALDEKGFYTYTHFAEENHSAFAGQLAALLFD